MRLLTNHFPDRYRHSVCYFGLLAPRLRRKAQDALESCIPHLTSVGNTGRSSPPAREKSRAPRDSRVREMHRGSSVSPQNLKLYQKQ
jgi:hypothetical protein